VLYLIHLIRDLNEDLYKKPFREEFKELLGDVAALPKKRAPSVRYKQRLEKNRDTLFTFRDHNNVPWKNNNAEHAIKAFEMMRRDFEGLSTERGIKEYLILLRVCETCKFKGINLLDFLRPGEKDVQAFASSLPKNRARLFANHKRTKLSRPNVWCT
jgi:hypothetical protein